jgi:hypothetical protein
MSANLVNYTNEELCSLAPRPLLITAFLLAALRNHYSNADNIEHELCKTRLFTPTDQSELMIEDATVWQPTKTGLRPVIIVRREAWQSPKQFAFGNAAGADADGKPRFYKMWQGSHTVLCGAKEGAETELLLGETSRMLMHYSPVYRPCLKLLMFEVTQVDKLTQMPEANMLYVAPVVVTYGWSEVWSLDGDVPDVTNMTFTEMFDDYLGGT